MASIANQNTAMNRDCQKTAEHTFKKVSMIGGMAFIALKIRWMLLSVTVGYMGICGNLINVLLKLFTIYKYWHKK